MISEARSSDDTSLAQCQRSTAPETERTRTEFHKIVFRKIGEIARLHAGEILDLEQNEDVDELVR